MTFMKQLLYLLIFLPMMTSARHQVISPNVKSLEVILNNDFTALPILQLGSDDHLQIGFDELSHDYHRYVCHLEPCNPDWTPAEGIFESDWLVGFNDVPIDDYENSINTRTLYTHYSFQFPNTQCRIKMSGNYRIYINDEDSDDENVAIIEFRVLEQLTHVGLGVTTNTDIDLNKSHQQVSMTVNLNNINVTRPEEQIQTFVMQNGREDNMKENAAPNYITPQSLRWEHNRHLIFEAGNEYHKYEILDPRHITMGLAAMTWDEDSETYHAVPYPCSVQSSYLYDEDANGAFLLRNSDNYEATRTSEYVFVHYLLKVNQPYDNARILIDGRWTTEDKDNYVMSYDESQKAYHGVILQKLGYYNYQFLMEDLDGTTHQVPEEGSFFQTENTYQAFVYYRGTGERTWRLVGYQQKTFKP
jgi:hypothetical protein